LFYGQQYKGRFKVVTLKSKDALTTEGFEGFKTIEELFLSFASIPKEKGVYLVLREGGKEPEFFQTGVGGHFKSKDPNIEVNRLKEKWVYGTEILYIGKAGAAYSAKSSSQTLNRRVSYYMKFGMGKAVGHYGGRYIWQLKDYKNLILCWKTLPEKDADPRDLEKKMLNEFYDTYGTLPFANLKK
jgi:hypothetical protein